MADPEFIKEFKDISVETGDETGFQFELTCRSCKKVWQSDFFPHSTGGAWVKTGLFKKNTGENTEARAAWQKAKAETLAKVADEVEKYFVYCSKCCHYVCENCYQPGRNACLACIAAMAQEAIESGLRAQQEELQREREAKCPKCNTLVGTAKFCPKCGTKMMVRGICPHCNAKIPKEAVFCTECGQKVLSSP